MKNTARNLLTSPWLLHTPCCMLALLGCAAILWPLYTDEELQEMVEAYAGTLVLGSFIASFSLMLTATAFFFLRMRNLRAIGQASAWGIQWGLAVVLFAFLAIRADVPPPPEPEALLPIQTSDTLHTPSERLTSPASLVLYIESDEFGGDKVADTPNLSKLGEQHAEILHEFIAQAPRWAFAGQEDTFYTQPGHVVLELPASGGIPGHVHVTFRTLTSGAQLPAGYVVIKPGGDFPKQDNEKNGPPDYALEIDSRHFLLLAWRGSKQETVSHKAINAAIVAIDARLQELAETPTQETIANMLEGKRTTIGNMPELRVCEPPTQYGIYQAEIYANTGRAGTLSLTIRDLETQEVLRQFSFPAQYSSDPNELFRYDIPGFSDMQNHEEDALASLFPKGSPFFAIKQGSAHQYFGVAFEVSFLPEGKETREKVLRRCYKAQAYEKAIPPTDEAEDAPNPLPGQQEEASP